MEDYSQYIPKKELTPELISKLNESQAYRDEIWLHPDMQQVRWFTQWKITQKFNK